MPPLVRKATIDDVQPLIELSRRTIDACYRSFLGDEAVDAYLGSAEVSRYVVLGLVRCRVILNDDQIVGCAVYSDDVIEMLMVDVRFHRQGFGGELLKHVEALLLDRHGSIRLESFVKNEKANAFYRSNGWQELRRYTAQGSGGEKIVFGKSA